MFLRSHSPNCRALLALLALLSACAQSGGSDRTASDAPKELSKTTGPYLKSVCGNDTNCSPSVSLLTIRSKGDLTQCLGTLVGSDLLVTTSRCIPEELRSSGAKCGNIIHAQFPAVGAFPETQAECREIVSAASLYDRTLAQTDYAFIRLVAPVSRPALQVDHSGLGAGGSYQVIGTESFASSSGQIARMTSRTCRAVQGCEALPGSVHPESSVMTITDCATGATSEGAPILDEQGRIHGIIQAPVPASRLLRRIGDYRLPEPGIGPISWATNFSCVHFPENDGDFALPTACQEDPNKPNEQSIKLQSDTLINQGVQATDARFSWPQLSSDLQWTTNAFSASSPEGRILSQELDANFDVLIFAIPVPKCIVKGSTLSATAFKLPVIGYSSALDRNLVLNLDKGQALEGVSVRLEVNPPGLRWTSIPNMLNKSVSIFIDSGRKPRLLRAALPECSP
ncbi:MAG: trypsin-like peptidase domain-containing protein [Bdellovibrionia bacterium]